MRIQIPEKYNRKLATKLILYILLWSSVLTLAITALQLYLDYDQDLDFIEAQFEQIEKSHIPVLTKNIWTVNLEQIQIQLEGISQLPYMQHIKLDIADEHPITVGEPKHEYVLTQHFQLKYDDQAQQYVVGTLELTADLEVIYQHLWEKLLMILMSQAIKTFLVSAFIFFIVQRLIIQYLKAIVRYVQSIDLQHLETPLELKTQHKVPEELQELTNGINQMRSSLRHESEKIQAMTQTFKKFVPQQFLTRIASEGLENIQLGKAESDSITIYFPIFAHSLLFRRPSRPKNCSIFSTLI